MTKTVTGVLLAVISVGLIGSIVYATAQDSKGASPNTTSSADSSHFNQDHKDDGHHQSDEMQAAPNAVFIKDFEFGPKAIQVKAGTTVTWTNQDSAKHDIAPDNESSDFVASQLLAKGESYSFTFTKAGTYSYHCSPHPYMKAVVEVTE